MGNFSFSTSDIQQLERVGISPQAAQEQLHLFKKGTPFAQLARPATLGDGIFSISTDQAVKLTTRFETAQLQGRVMKFVPASGAATRMFKNLYAAKEELAANPNYSDKHLETFLSSLKTFAFFDELKQVAGLPSEDNSAMKDHALTVLNALLGASGMNYGQKPKGLLAFHTSDSGPKTPVEEHFEEALAYCLDENKVAKLHFTVSPEHQSGFEQIVEKVTAHLQPQGIQLDVTFSIQKPSTDTLAAQPDGTPFRHSDNSLVLRPGGHGALIDNLADLDGDIVILKNIDNVVPKSHLETTIQYKKLLGGLLLEVQDSVFKYLAQLEMGQLPPRKELFGFLQKYLGVRLAPEHRMSDTQLISYLKTLLNRPIRVCGMVRNTGEPGGGPFWIKAENGSESLQIVETSQIDTNSASQKEMLNQATHFNPVDLVCSLRDAAARPYQLKDFIDPNTYFIATKSQNGKPLLALERPGLWNGAMANWNTIFVEVPLATFNPVKTVLDLLRPNHLSES